MLLKAQAPCCCLSPRLRLSQLREAAWTLVLQSRVEVRRRAALRMVVVASNRVLVASPRLMLLRLRVLHSLCYRAPGFWARGFSWGLGSAVAHSASLKCSPWEGCRVRLGARPARGINQLGTTPLFKYAARLDRPFK